MAKDFNYKLQIYKASAFFAPYNISIIFCQGRYEGLIFFIFVLVIVLPQSARVTSVYYFSVKLTPRNFVEFNAPKILYFFLSSNAKGNVIAFEEGFR